MKNARLIWRSRRSRVTPVAVCMGMGLLFLGFLLWGVQGVIPVHADPGTLYVDGASGSDASNCQNPAMPCATIGHALSQATNGDTILVAEGIYTETLDIGSTVSLKGGYEAAGWTRDIAAHPTTVDGSGANASVFNITPTAVLTVEGFIVRGGNIPSDSGGGFLINGATVVISGTVVRDNTASIGGGVWVEGENGQVNVSFINASLLANTATSEGGGLGGGSMPAGSLIMLDNVEVRGNVAGSGSGGGLNVDGRVVITNSRITSNTASGHGGGVFATDVFIYNSEISGNEADGDGSISGGGVRASGSLLLQGSSVSNNRATGTDEGLGGGVNVDFAEVTIVDTIISGNSAGSGSQSGAAVQLFQTIFTMTNSLVISNTGFGFSGGTLTGTINSTTVADNSEGGLSVDGAIATTNSILWGNGSNDYGCSGNCTLAYSDVGFGDTTGNGNISTDPLFVGGGDYHLQSSSPAVDAGTNVGAPASDFEGDPRPLDGNLDGTATTDMGADEFRPLHMYLPLVTDISGS